MSAVIRNAWASMLGRRAATTGMFAIVTMLTAALFALTIPLWDGRDNLAQHYQRAGWSHVWLLESVLEDQKAVARQVESLRERAGISEVSVQYVVPGRLGSQYLTVQSYDPAFEVELVEGRAPRPGTCEAVVTRSTGIDASKGQMTIALERDPGTGRDLPESVDVTVVGVIERTYPLLVDAVMTACDLASYAVGPSALLVRTDGTGDAPAPYAATLQQVADRNIRADSSSGMLALVVLLVALLSVVVTASVGRWAVRSRQGEFATLRLWGYSRREILAQVVAEMTMIWLVTTPLGIGAGILLAWKFMRRVGDVADPSSGLWVAVPSPGTVGVVSVGMLVALVTFTVLPAMAALRPGVAAMLRRRGE